MKRILIVGNWRTIHVKRFLQQLCSNNVIDLIVDAYDPCYDEGQENDCGVDKVYRLNSSNIEKKIFSIRKIGAYLLQKKKVATLKNIIRQNKYDVVNIHFIPINVLEMVKVCRRYNTKVMLTPLGSDVLRVSNIYKQSIKHAFLLANYVSFNILTGFCKDVCTKYGIPSSKIVNLGYGSEIISSILNLYGKYSREEHSKMLSIPYSKFNIVCGYNASLAQRQDVIFKSILENKNKLPVGYQIIFPLSYGNEREEIKNRIIKLNKNHNLNVFFLDKYLTTDQVASLRLISDLFIHIQTTDAYNSSLQEFIISNTEIINGKWLKYPDLESYGSPYYKCESIESLPDIIANVLNRNIPKIRINPEVYEIIKENAWDKKIIAWWKFYMQL